MPQPGPSKGAAKHGYDVVLFGSPEMTGRSGLPDPYTFARDYNFQAGLTRSEVMIYIGHGAGNNTPGSIAKPFEQVGIVIDASFYTKDGTMALDDQRRQTNIYLDKPEVSAQVMVNFSCDASRNGGDYFKFTGKGQFMVTLNGGADGVTNAGTIEKAAVAFVKTYASTRGDTRTKVQAATNAANKVFRESVKKFKTNEGDALEFKQVN